MTSRDPFHIFRMLRAIQRSFALSRPLEEKLSGTGKYFNYKKGYGIVETKIGDVLIFHVSFIFNVEIFVTRLGKNFYIESTHVEILKIDKTIHLEFVQFRTVHFMNSILVSNQIQPDESPDAIYFRWTSSEFC